MLGIKDEHFARVSEQQCELIFTGHTGSDFTLHVYELELELQSQKKKTNKNKTKQNKNKPNQNNKKQ